MTDRTERKTVEIRIVDAGLDTSAAHIDWTNTVKAYYDAIPGDTTWDDEPTVDLRAAVARFNNAR